MKQENVDIVLGSKFDGKGFKLAETAAEKLQRKVNSLAKSYLSLYAAQRVARSAFNAAKAFAEDDAAAQRLANSVKNLGLAYANDDIRKYIDSLTLATGVADTQLRPALQSLLQVTGSVAKSQELLANAIDISRGSGEDLATVSNDLSQAYVGNLKGLRKYNLGLTQAELKASSFADIQKRLNDLFAGSSSAYLATYSGQMQILANTAKEAQETIGKDLVDALILVSGQKGIQGLSKDMSDLAVYTGNVIYGMGVLIDQLNNNRIVKLFGGFDINMIPIIGGIIDNLARLGASAKAAQNTFNFASGGGMGTGSTKGITDRQAAAAEKLAKKRQQDLINAQKQQLKIAKEQAALQKAGTLFDIQQAQIIAALKGEITDEERTRLELQLAILTGNTVEASKLAEQLGKSQGLTESLRKYLADIPTAKNPFEAWKLYLDAIEAQARRIAGITPAAPVSIAGGNTSGVFSPAVQEMIAASTPSVGVGAGGDVNVYVAGSVVSEADLVEAVSNGLLNRSLSGSPSAIGRLKGSFTA